LPGSLGGLVDRIPAEATWNELVIRPAARRELELVTRWGNRTPSAAIPDGFACLFHGPPGTGKTLAAQVIANELGLELYRVDLSRVVDKYIGETEKHLDRVFEQAADAGAIVFFDEADVLFARRTEVKDARDRYANLETGYLLQRIEQHEGLVVLATNLAEHIDAAFRRRLPVVAEFPLPSRAERVALWRLHLQRVRDIAPDVDAELLAAFDGFSGGDIRNAVTIAALLAQGESPLAMRHAVAALWREARKAGRILDIDGFGPWRGIVAAIAEQDRGHSSSSTQGPPPSRR
jgi:SpoVK/Ycf46/Vps4 family AAA+-type ATPase